MDCSDFKMSEIYEPEEDSYLLSSVLEKEIPELIKQSPDLIFLEMGCGSGINLSTAFKCGIKKENIYGADLNPSAVNHCNKLGFNCVKSNLFEQLKGIWDVIVFNPPYLPEDKNEPMNSRLATTGGKNGSEIINGFLKQAKNHLKIDGRIFLLSSSLTKGINWQNYKKEKIASKKVFFEELYIWKLILQN